MPAVTTCGYLVIVIPHDSLHQGDVRLNLFSKARREVVPQAVHLVRC